MSNFRSEYKTLKECYPTLVSCVQQSPSDVVVQLIPSGILAQDDLSFLRNPHHDGVSKAMRLVDIVMTQVQNDPDVFHVFIKALRAAGPWTERTVEKLEHLYKFTNSYKSSSEDEKMVLLWSAMPELTLEELYALPVEKVWYQLGLWLGVDERKLEEIQSKTPRLRQANEKGSPSKEFDAQLKKMEMFKAVFDSSLGSEDHTDSIQEPPAWGGSWALTLHHNQTSRKRMIDDSKGKASDKELSDKLRQKIVNALVKVGHIKEAEMFISKDISFTTYLHLTDPASDPPDYVLQYADHLKRRYQQMSVFPNDWPPSTTTTDQRYSQLALVSSKRIDHKAMTSTEKDYLHGNVDRIVAQKESIALDELFYPIINKSTNTSRLTILLDGAPGVGKTTITRKLCIDWANGDLLQEYQLVVYVPLREAVGDSVASLLPSSTEVDKVAEYLLQSNISGKNTLFIFDGFDELSSEDRSKKSLFIKIIRGEILPDCSVLVASRPYASSKALSSLSRINRHVEVLGFSMLEVVHYIRVNLPSQEAAQNLIEMLKERLDIISMCYIPLNCNIVLFVFEQQQYQLPNTLTELYETFILHTIKRSVEKNETDLECDVESIDDLPPELLTSLNNLCEIAFVCLSKDKLYLEKKNLRNAKESLSLGLLNCLQVMNSRSLPVEHYQFLHLTIQEFLAARYLASDKYTEGRHKFLLEHIDDVRYRMTLLFLAGLTKLDFVPNNTSLLGDQTIDLTEAIHVSQDSTIQVSDFLILLNHNNQQVAKQKDQEKLILVAHIIFESQIKVLSTPLAFCSNALIISGRSLTPFDKLVLSYFLSTTSLTHVWNIIDFSNCRLPSDSVLYTAPHFSHPDIIAIGTTKCLTLESIALSSIIQIINTSQTLEEVCCKISSNTYHTHYKCYHDEANQLCAAISASNTLTTVKMDGIVISRKKFSIKDVPEICSNSLTKLLDFAKGDSLECIEIPKSKAFQDCTSCQSLGSQAVDSLCRVLEKNKSIKQIDLSDCNLESEAVHSLLTILNSEAKVRKLNLDGIQNSISDYSIQELLGLLETGTELTFLGMHLNPNEECLQVKQTDFSNEDIIDAIEEIFLYFKLPSCFTSIDIRINLSYQAMLSLLANNQHLQQVALPDYSPTRDEQEPTCVSTSMMINAITTHDNLQLFAGLHFKVSSNEGLHIEFFENICVFSTKLLLDFVTIETLEAISIHSCPIAFQACAQCTAETVTMVIDTLCKIIKSSRNLRIIALQHCELKKHFMEKIVTSLEESSSEHLESIWLSGNDLTSKSVTKLLHINTSKKLKCCEIFRCLIELNIDGDHLTLNGSKPSKLNHLLQILACPSEIKYLTVSLAGTDDLPTIDLVTALLVANPHFVEIKLPLMNFDRNAPCTESLTFTKALSAHKSMQMISFLEKIYFPPSVTITRQTLDIGNLILCPNALPHLLKFVRPEEVDTFKIPGNFEDCPTCGSGGSGENAQRSLLECLVKCINLKKLDLSILPKGMLEKLICSISEHHKLQLLGLAFNYPTTESLILILGLTAFSLTEFHVSNLIITVEDNINMLIRCFKISDDCTYLNTILQSLAQKSDCQLRRLAINRDIALTDDHVEGLKSLLTNSECKIEFLSLSRNTTSPLFMETLIHCMRSNTTLKELHLNSLYLKSKTILLIKALIDNRTLKYLDLSSNNLSLDSESTSTLSDVGTILQELLENNQCLSVLNLSDCNLPVSVIHHIEIGLMSNTTLTELDLSCHDFLTGSDSETFGQSIEMILTRNQSLQVLSLLSCRFTEIVMSCIAKALTTNSTLNELYLDSALIREQPTLSKYSIFLDTSKTQAWLILFSALKQNSSLHTLSVCKNRFDKEEFSALKYLLHHNTTITTLKVVDCGFSATQLSELEEELPTKDGLVASREQPFEALQQKSMKSYPW